ncbi:acyl-CoA-binding protein [Bactrocera dorsalis]|uniref:Acyl-CoA-binding protein n=1 Tax=Bactrocera dorsalis TaxID=27457 RepID=A0A6I9VDN0_BACDO|nr:acyl-CoA-binding protein [Bactrocera dorsalis]
MVTFEEIIEKARNFSKKPTQEEFLEFYGYYKQATVGDCNTDEPEDPVRKALWNSWKEKAGLSVEDAKAHYIEVYKKYAPKYE